MGAGAPGDAALNAFTRAIEFLAAIPGWLMITALVVLGIGAGWLCERMMARWANRARQASAGWGDSLLGAVHRMPIIWFAAGGAYLGMAVAGYGGDALTVDVAREVVSEVEGGLTDEEPFVRFEEFSDFSINFLLRVPVRQFTDQFLIRHELVKRLHRRYGTEGIEIPFPIRTVHMRDPDRRGHQEATERGEAPGGTEDIAP